jgi:ADP-heptose:LPS heptosyltransferase
MTVPVVRQLLLQNPQLQITFVSVPMVAPLFEGIERLSFVPAHLKGVHKGIKGMYRLHRELNAQSQFDAVADLHNVLRTKILRFLFSLSGVRTASIDKGRKEKGELTRIEGKKLRPLPSTFLRYAVVFRQLHLSIDIDPSQPVISSRPSPRTLEEKKAQGHKLIGIAPFAKHAEKTYPLERMKEVVRTLSERTDTHVYLFGGRGEAELLQSWAEEFSNVESMAGKGTFAAELECIAALHLVVSMDSANMHLASLFGVRVVSIWGSTHPFAGFYGWGQAPDDAVQVALYCRPCSVFGNRKCYRGDLACLRSIEAETVVKKIEEALA